MVWVWRDLKDYLVPAPFTRAETGAQWYQSPQKLGCLLRVSKHDTGGCLCPSRVAAEESGDKYPGHLGRVGQVSPSQAREHFLTSPNKLQTSGLKAIQRGSRSNRVITRLLNSCHKENLLGANIWMVLQQHIKGKAKDGERPVFTGNLTKRKLLPGHKTKQTNIISLLCAIRREKTHAGHA